MDQPKYIRIPFLHANLQGVPKSSSNRSRAEAKQASFHPLLLGRRVREVVPSTALGTVIKKIGETDDPSRVQSDS